jgi:hypothetical protein
VGVRARVELDHEVALRSGARRELRDDLARLRVDDGDLARTRERHNGPSGEDLAAIHVGHSKPFGARQCPLSRVFFLSSSILAPGDASQSAGVCDQCTSPRVAEALGDRRTSCSAVG